MTPRTRLSDDAAIITRSVAEPETFAAIFDLYALTLHRYLSRRLGTAEADDLLSEVFLRAFEGRAKFDLAAESARPWLLGIATNLIRNRHRSEERQYRALARAAYQVLEPVTPDDEIAARVDAAAVVGPLSVTLASLAQGDRDVLLLFAWGDLSYGDIAAALGIPVGTVRSRLSRTRTILRAAIGEAHLDGPTT